MKSLSSIPTFVWRLLFAIALLVVAFLTDARANESVSDCACVAKPHPESWVFARSRYTHDPDTGGRIAQYAQKAPVEPLPDQRAVTSGYRRTRSVMRGADGSVDTTYQVQSYGNGRGGLNAEWERFHDAWRGATIGGGNFYSAPNYAFGFGGYPNYGAGGVGFGNFYPPVGQPGFQNSRGFGGDGFGPGFGRPDAGRLDPDAADGFRDGRTRTPDRRFFNQAVPSAADRAP